MATLRHLTLLPHWGQGELASEVLASRCKHGIRTSICRGFEIFLMQGGIALCNKGAETDTSLSIPTKGRPRDVTIYFLLKSGGKPVGFASGSSDGDGTLFKSPSSPCDCGLRSGREARTPLALGSRGDALASCSESCAVVLPPVDVPSSASTISTLSLAFFCSVYVVSPPMDEPFSVSAISALMLTSCCHCCAVVLPMVDVPLMASAVATLFLLTMDLNSLGSWSKRQAFPFLQLPVAQN